jgi:dCMP deaminase
VGAVDPKWDRRFLDAAIMIAGWSKDRSTKVGAVIVGPNREIRATGYNGPPRGIDDTVEEFHTRPIKYLVFEHGERNACYNAARIGVSLEGCCLYVATIPKGLPPCADCARAIIQSGIVRVVWEGVDDAEGAARWGDSCAMGARLMASAGVEMVKV